MRAAHMLRRSQNLAQEKPVAPGKPLLRRRVHVPDDLAVEGIEPCAVAERLQPLPPSPTVPLAYIEAYTCELLTAAQAFHAPAHRVENLLASYPRVMLPLLEEARVRLRVSSRSLLLTLWLVFAHFSRNSMALSRASHALAYLLIAVKFQEVHPPTLGELVELLGGPNPALRLEVLCCEAIILTELEFRVALPPLFELLDLSSLCSARPLCARLLERLFLRDFLPQPQLVFCRPNGLLLAAAELQRAARSALKG